MIPVNPLTRLLPLLLLFTATLLRAATTDHAAATELLRTTRLAWGAPGLAAAIVVDGNIVWAAGDGHADLENLVPAGPDTVFRFASISKPIAATAFARLLATGRVSLDQPIWHWLHDYPRKDPHLITPRHLLTHTSGIRHYREGAGEMDSKQHFANVRDSLRAFNVHEDPLLFPPGEKFHYSTFAYELVAGIVESASGEPYATHLQREIFDRAGMATARFENHETLIPGRARFYRRARQAGGVVNAPWVDNSYKLAGGAVVGTVLDLAHFAIALDSGRLLDGETHRLVLTPHRLNDGTLSDYGLGWRIDPPKDGRRWVHHSGGAVGGAAFLLRCPEERFAVAILCNLESPGALKQFALDLAATILPPATAAAAR